MNDDELPENTDPRISGPWRIAQADSEGSIDDLLDVPQRLEADPFPFDMESPLDFPRPVDFSDTPFARPVLIEPHADRNQDPAAVSPLEFPRPAEPTIELPDPTFESIQFDAPDQLSVQVPLFDIQDERPLKAENESSVDPFDIPLVPVEYTPESAEVTVRRSGLAYSAGIAFFVSVSFMLFLGWIADLLFGTSPWGIVGGIVLGSIIGFIQFFRISAQIFGDKEPKGQPRSLMSQSGDDERLGGL